MIASVGFWLVAAALLVCAAMAVTAKHLINAVLWLGTVLALTAVLFIALGAPLLGGLQVLLYVGGVMTLMIFGVMLTGAGEHEKGQARPWAPARALIASVVLFGALAGAILSTEVPSKPPNAPVSTAAIGESLLTSNLLAFEVLSALLLAAMIGAIVLARRADQGAPQRIARPTREEP